VSRRFELVAPMPLEHDLQIDCTKMLRVILLADVCWTAIDHAHSLNMAPGRNGRPIGLAEMHKRQARGIEAGIMDYALWHGGRGFAIELKRSAEEDLSEPQKVFLNRLIRSRIEVAVCWTRGQVFQRVYDWGLVRPGVRLR
jgi:hypothetical protein